MKKIKKDLNKDQHFLGKSTVIKRQIDVSNISEKDRIIEIGAGDGSLTCELIKRAGRVLAFEIDIRYAKKLAPLEKRNKNLKVIYDNALSYSWKECTKIVSNIPFSISEPLINKSIKEEIPEIILIVGEKFKKILEQNKTKIGIIANIFYNIEFIMKVDKKSFLPPPKVDSWLIKLKKKKKFSEIESLLISILNKKGKLKNAILYSLIKKGKKKRESEIIINNIDIHQHSLEKPVSRITGKLLIRLTKELEKLEKLS